MELKEFIKNSVSDIVDAIGELKDKYPSNREDDTDGQYQPIAPYVRMSTQSNASDTIDFDIAISSTEGKEVKGGGKAGIKVISANMEMLDKNQNQNISRVKFSIPLTPEYISKKP
jgi:hypothetical protein